MDQPILSYREKNSLTCSQILHRKQTLRNDVFTADGSPISRACFGFWNTGGGGGYQVHTNGSWVPSGPTRASVFGRCGVPFTLTGAQAPQDLPGSGAAEGQGEEKWGGGACEWLMGEERLSSEDQERKDLVWRTRKQMSNKSE